MTENKEELDELRNIKRMDYPKKGSDKQTTHRAWWVRIKRGKTPHNKYFSDNKYGGEEQALAAAIKYRDELEKELGFARTGFEAFRRKTNKSGIAGIHKSLNTSRRKNGKSYSYLCWYASWLDPITGKRRNRSFAIPKFGEAEALRLAIKAREEAIENILGIKRPTPEWGKLPLEKLVEVVENAQTAYEKGRALEELIYVLFEGVSGFSVNDTNVTTETEEIDLVILNDSTDPRFSRESAILLIECKNWSSKCGKNEFVIFKEKIENRSNRCTLGFLISWNGFAETVTKEMLRGSHEQALVIPIDGETIKNGIKDGDFQKVLLDAWHRTVTL